MAEIILQASPRPPQGTRPARCRDGNQSNQELTHAWASADTG